jgi:hypothetical protein
MARHSAILESTDDSSERVLVNLAKWGDGKVKRNVANAVVISLRYPDDLPCA